MHPIDRLLHHARTVFNALRAKETPSVAPVNDGAYRSPLTFVDLEQKLTTERVKAWERK